MKCQKNVLYFKIEGVYLYLLIKQLVLLPSVINIVHKVDENYPQLPLISHRKRFKQKNVRTGPAHVGTSYITLWALEKDATHLFGPAHAWPPVLLV